MGGYPASRITVDTVQVYDPASREWSTLAPMPTVRGGIHGIAVNGSFFAFGGEGPNGVFDEMEMYVPDQDQMRLLKPTRTVRSGAVNVIL